MRKLVAMKKIFAKKQENQQRGKWTKATEATVALENEKRHENHWKMDSWRLIYRWFVG
ncbi:MAG: hypothetical protein IKP87_10240 [Victivallales bacterium]|nr:hypothetical protein [Victivallales bacterium]